MVSDGEDDKERLKVNSESQIKPIPVKILPTMTVLERRMELVMQSVMV